MGGCGVTALAPAAAAAYVRTAVLLLLLLLRQLPSSVHAAVRRVVVIWDTTTSTTTTTHTLCSSQASLGLLSFVRSSSTGHLISYPARYDVNKPTNGRLARPVVFRRCDVIDCRRIIIEKEEAVWKYARLAASAGRLLCLLELSLPASVDYRCCSVDSWAWLSLCVAVDVDLGAVVE